MKKSLLLLAAASLLVGCSSARWYKSGGTSSAAFQDLIDCRAEARRQLDPNGIGGFMPLVAKPNIDGFIEDCMQSKGYQSVNPGAVPEAANYPESTL